MKDRVSLGLFLIGFMYLYITAGTSDAGGDWAVFMQFVCIGVCFWVLAWIYVLVAKRINAVIKLKHMRKDRQS